ncbi:MAG: hypothetical protein H2069_09495 [Legionella sp.]|nr:hypothetical protein [Legionella sp.]
MLFNKSPRLAITLHQGFSLIESLLIVALISIITYLVYPLYQQNTLKAGRTDAKLALFDLANRMENYYTRCHSYEKATLGTGKTTDIKHDVFSNQGLYRLSIDSQSVTQFTLRATAVGKQIVDTNCSFFTLNQRGEKGGSFSLTASCW